MVCTSFSDGRAAGSLSNHRSTTAMIPLRPPGYVPSPAVVQHHAQLASRKLSSTAAVIHDSRRPLNTRTLCAWPAWYRHTHARQTILTTSHYYTATRSLLLPSRIQRYNSNKIADTKPPRQQCTAPARTQSAHTTTTAQHEDTGTRPSSHFTLSHTFVTHTHLYNCAKPAKTRSVTGGPDAFFKTQSTPTARQPRRLRTRHFTNAIIKY